MYQPKYHALNDHTQMYAHIEQHPLGGWVCQTNDGLVANHIPFVLDRTYGEHGRLIGHVSRANQVWRQLLQGTPSVVMFLGPQAYITPSWYPGKREHGKVVPTWNYVTVHAHGNARAIEDGEWILSMLHQLTNAQESPRPSPWSVADAPKEYVENLLRSIVGIEVRINRLEGRLKVSQDEAVADRYGTVEGLMSEQDSQLRAMAELVRQQIGSPL